MLPGAPEADVGHRVSPYCSTLAVLDALSGDHRFPIPGILSVAATVLTAVTSAISGHWPATAAASTAAAALVT